MAQKKSNQNSNIYSVEILSADNMGRIITTGCKAFDFGILLPQFILLDGNLIPFDSSIAFIKGMLSKSEKIEVKPMRFIEKQNSKFAFVTLNVKGANELKTEFHKLKEGELYKVTIDSENESYYSVSVDNTMFRGYIDKSNLNDVKYNIGESVSVRLYKTGSTPLDYLVFIPDVAGIDIHAVSGTEISQEDANSLFEAMFTDLERDIMPDEDATFAKNILQIYPNTTRKDTVLNDLESLYVRFDGRLRIVLDKLNRINPNYLTNCV